MTRTVFREVRVYRDGGFGQPTDVVVDDGVIVEIAEGAASGHASASGEEHVHDVGVHSVDVHSVDVHSVDVHSVDVHSGGYLIPGLIDAHIHLDGAENLEQLADHGVTTALDMGSPTALVDSLRGTPGVTDIRSGLMVATSPSSAHAQRMHLDDDTTLVGSPEQADAWVARHVEDGADYIKIVIDLPGFDVETVTAIVDAAHRRDRITVVHASSFDAVAMAQAAGVDVLTHAPLDRPIGAEQAAALTAAGAQIVPTLVMMRDIVSAINPNGGPGPRYAAAEESVRTLHEAGMTIIAGTDANRAPAAPAAPAHGESMHEELELLVAAGLSPADTLDAATSSASARFGLDDRGSIAQGLRADLVLLEDDPTTDIRATRSIRGVWCGGVRRR
ncbi:amidohydrolase family protein [Rathayibacter sp. CAU 1779]